MPMFIVVTGKLLVAPPDALPVCIRAGLTFCNACGIFLKTHKRHRPVDVETHTLVRTTSGKVCPPSLAPAQPLPRR